LHITTRNFVCKTLFQNQTEFLSVATIVSTSSKTSCGYTETATATVAVEEMEDNSEIRCAVDTGNENGTALTSDPITFTISLLECKFH